MFIDLIYTIFLHCPLSSSLVFMPRFSWHNSFNSHYFVGSQLHFLEVQASIDGHFNYMLFTFPITRMITSGMLLYMCSKTVNL